MRARHPGLQVGDFRALTPPDDDLADSGIKAVVLRAGSADELGLLVISSAVDPLASERAADVTRRVREQLGPDAGSVVLEPLAVGRLGKRSYVMWPFHRVLHASRVANLARRLHLYPRVLRWLIDVVQKTAMPVPQSAIERSYASTLLSIADEPHFSVAMRDAAGRALVKVKSKRWQPYHALEHNDLWTGNLLAPRDRRAARQHARGFIVIDWEGARFEGYPVLDLVRFAQSAGLPNAWLKHELAKLRNPLRCELSDMPGYALAALGAMGQTLGYFPVDRFRELATETFELVRAAC